MEVFIEIWRSAESTERVASQGKVIPVRLLCIMQVLGQNANGTHDCLAHIKASRSLNDAVDHDVDFPAEHPVQRLGLERLRDAVPRQDELSVGALKDWGEQSQQGRAHQCRARPLSSTSNKHRRLFKACLVKHHGFYSHPNYLVQKYLRRDFIF